ncbi:MAG: asparagine synthase (glutamine-hydrolyzing), partial [Candidatus Rokubacteria bacterium]|nr:asparagine synthase (glutamine-hydrolyzing) [Candidatus Rokubacteria bacterium]
MCGIAGYVAPPGQRADRSILERMVGALRHRGPDGCGYLVEGRAALGVARLRVIDLDTGDQPLHGEDGRLSAVVNGEIYNFADLRAQLHHRGHRFATRSDSEVVVHAWEEWGEKALEHLNGMFAMALWDRGHEQLILARDRMGEKPLYYAVAGGALVFGSELRALLAHPGVARGLDLRGVARYLAFDYVPDPRSILEGVSKVPPGHVLTAGRDVSLAAYWDLTFQPDPTLDEAAWGDEIRRRFDRAVERRLASDVPLGCFLSGGVDSSAVAATAARFRPGIRTFSVGYARSPHDERRWARLVAERCGTTHEELEVGAADARHVMERLGDLLDEPLADMSFVPLYLLAGAARRRVTVALTGDGGDELFAGYPTMAAAWWHRRAATLPAPVVATLERAGRVRWLPDDLRRFLGALGERPEARNQVLLGGLRPSRYAPLLSAAARAALDGFDPYQDIEWTLERCPTEEPTARLIYQYCKLYLAGQNLVNADRASMAVGLELRAPFLDHTFVDLLGRVPSALKLTGLGGLKRLVKRALADRLPPEIRRRGKQGFGVPFAAWFRGPLASTVRAMLAP